MARRSRALTYTFFYTHLGPKGWGEPSPMITNSRKLESTSFLTSSKNPILKKRVGKGGGWDTSLTIKPSEDLWFKDTPVYIVPFVYGIVKEEEAYFEKETHKVQNREIGNSGNTKNGGTPTRRKKGAMHGCAMLVIPNFEDLGLVLDPKYRAAYDKSIRRFGGSRGVTLPSLPPPSFVAPPKDEHGFVLNGKCFEKARAVVRGGMSIDDEEEEEEDGDEEEDEVVSNYPEWDQVLENSVIIGTKCTKRLEGLASEIAVQCGTVVTSITKRQPVTLLVVSGEYKDWCENAKAVHALDPANKVAICTIEELEEVLALLAHDDEEEITVDDGEDDGDEL